MLQPCAGFFAPLQPPVTGTQGMAKFSHQPQELVKWQSWHDRLHFYGGKFTPTVLDLNFLIHSHFMFHAVTLSLGHFAANGVQRENELKKN